MSFLFAAVRPQRRGRSFVRPIIESLEDRTLLAGQLPTDTVTVNFTIGRMVADPVRDVVYVADQTDSRILAVNTDSGNEVASQTVESAPGALAVSLDDDFFYVAEPGDFQIQVLSLPNLTPVKTLNVGFAVNNLVATVNDHLFVTSESSSAYPLAELDAGTGQVLTTISPDPYDYPLLRTNAAGTDLYVGETGLSGPPTNIDEYDVSGPGPYTVDHGYLAPDATAEDFVVNESAGRIYTADYQVWGVGVTDMSTDEDSVWQFTGGPSIIFSAAAVAALPTGSVYGASTYGGVYQFDSSGAIQNFYPVVEYPYSMMQESLKLTPNGHLMCAASTFNGSGYVYQLSIIGASSLSFGSNNGNGSAGPTAHFTDSIGSGGKVAFNASASVPGAKHETLTSYAWNFGDGSTGSGVAPTHKYVGVGPFTVTLTVTNSVGQTDSYSASVLGGKISGTVYNDIRGNGAPDTGESGLKGWTVSLDEDSNGQMVTEATTLTSANGTYSFSGLTEGEVYYVTETTESNWLSTTLTQIEVALNSSASVSGQNFGNAQLPIISGTVYNDINGDGSDQVPLKGWVIDLYATNNGKVVGSAIARSTAADGNYAFTGLKPGTTYQINVVVPAGWTHTTPSRIDVTAVAGTNQTDNDFGVAKLASISGNVFNDLNGDGQKDDGEKGLGQWIVFIDANDNGVLDPGEVKVATAANGNFTLKNFAPGTYVIQLVVKSGWQSELPASASYTVVLTSGEILLDQNFAVTTSAS